jgi:hypothetical protein
MKRRSDEAERSDAATNLARRRAAHFANFKEDDDSPDFPLGSVHAGGSEVSEDLQKYPIFVFL